MRGASSPGELVQRLRCSMVEFAVLEPAALASRQRLSWLLTAMSVRFPWNVCALPLTLNLTISPSH